jgi:hypothetical protein
MIRNCLIIFLLLTLGPRGWAQDTLGLSRRKKIIAINRENAPAKNEDTSKVFTGKSEGKSIIIRSSKQNYLYVDWLNPMFESDLKMEKGMLPVNLKIVSSDSVVHNQVALLVNRKPAGSKIGVSSLYGQQKEFNYEDRVRLEEGINELMVEVNTPTLSKSSRVLRIRKEGPKLTLLPDEEVLGSERVSSSVYWWGEFDPVKLQGKPYVSKDQDVTLEFKVLTGSELSPNKMFVVHNGRRRTPGKNAQLIQDSRGNYTFSERLLLSELENPNEVYLEIMDDNRTVRSEKVAINYTPFRPNLHVLSMGVATNLQYTQKDARDFAGIFTNQAVAGGNRIFNRISIDTLIGKKATAYEIRGTIEELKVSYQTGNISSDDIIMAFISSHGFLLNDDFRIQGSDYSPTRRRSTSVSFRNDILALLEEIPCKKIIMIDACHSGGARANPQDINFAIEQLNRMQEGVSVFASSRGEEQSYEDTTWKNGAFTDAIVSGLSGGKADANGNDIITLHELSDYVSRQVSSMVQTVKQRPQNPILVNNQLGNLAIYVKQ